MLPQYTQLRDSVKDKIEKGVFKPGARIPTRQEIMMEYGFARVTVDRAINELIREGLLRAEKGAGTYVIDGHREQEIKRTVYIVLHKETRLTETALWPFIDKIRYGINNEYKLEFLTIYDMRINPERFVEKARAVILCQVDPMYLEIAQLLQQRRCPVLLLNRKDMHFDYVTTDTFQGILRALELNKSRTIGIISESSCLDQPYRIEREAAFYRAVSLSGLSTKENWHIYCDVENPEPGIREMLALFSSEDRPTTLFISGFLVPYVLSTIHASKIKLGSDVHLIHFDPVPGTQNKKGIICLEQDFHEMGTHAMEWLNQLDEDKQGRFQKEIMPKITLWGEEI